VLVVLGIKRALVVLKLMIELSSLSKATSFVGVLIIDKYIPPSKMMMNYFLKMPKHFITHENLGIC
jgi:hypothetical protein